MADVNLFSGLVRGFGGTMMNLEKEKRDREERDRNRFIEILTRASENPDLTDEGRQQVWQILMNGGKMPGQGGKSGGKGKSGGAGNIESVLGPLIEHATKGGSIGGPPPAPNSSAPAAAPAAPPAPNAAPPQAAAPAPVSQVQPPPAPPASTAAAPAATPTSAAVGQPPPAPPAPTSTAPQMFMTHEQKVQRQIDDAVAVEKAKIEAGETGKDVAVQRALKRLQDNNIQVTPEVKTRIIEDLSGVKATSQRPYFGRDRIAGKDLPEGATDDKGQPIRKDGTYREVYTSEGFQGYTLAEAPKPTPIEQKFQERVKDYQSANPMRKDETPQAYAQRSQLEVRKMQYEEDSQRLIGLGLRNQATKANIQRVYKGLQSGNVDQKTAKILWDGAWRAARMRKQTELDSFNKPVNDLVSEELQRVGTSYEEVTSLLRSNVGTQTTKPQGGKAGAGGKRPPKVTIEPNGAISISPQ